MELLDLSGPADPHGSPYGPGTADALAATCQLVAALFRSPGEALRSDLESGRLAQVVDALAHREGLEPPPVSRAAIPIEDLEVAYVALFVSRAGGVPAPPYVGLVHDHQLLGPTVGRLRSELEALGLRAAPSWLELPDHLSVVAEAIDLLLERGRVGAARTLAGRYLAPWFERYAGAVAAADDSGFYGELSCFLRNVLKELTA